jgi:hypothetical protein
LGKIGTAAVQADKELVRLLLNDTDAETRRCAALALREIDGDPNIVITALIRAAADSDLAVRQNVCGALGKYGRRASPAMTVLGELRRDREVSPFANCAMRRISSDNRPGDLWPTMAFRSALQEIKGVSQPSAVYILTGESITGGPNGTLSGAYRNLRRLLELSGYQDHGLYACPGGFAMATAVERIHEDGTPFEEPNRWLPGRLPMGRFDIDGYFRRLFKGELNHFRVFLFVMTDFDIEAKKDSLSENEARAWVTSSGTLPEAVARAPTDRKKCYCFVYHYPNKGDQSRLLIPSKVPAKVHLVRSGILNDRGEPAVR